MSNSSTGILRYPGFGAMTWALYLFLYAPIVVFVVFSFNDSLSVSIWEGFSTRWFGIALANEDLRAAVLNTLIIAGVATAAATALAIPAAITTSAQAAATRANARFLAVIALPLMIPEIVIGIAMLSFFTAIGLLLGRVNIILAHTMICLPFAYMPIAARLRSLDPRIWEAANDLYADRWRCFRDVMLPLLAPGIAAGAMLAFIVSFDNFIITFMVASAGGTTLPLYIYGMVKTQITPELNALSTLVLLISLLLLLAAHLSSRGRLMGIGSGGDWKRGESRSTSTQHKENPMKLKLSSLVVPAAMLFAPAFAAAEGQLNLFSWAGYTPPDLVEKFEAETGISVTIDTYDTNEALLAKLKAGGGDYDIIVPAHSLIPILKAEGLIQSIGLKEMANFGNLDAAFVDPAWDPDGNYSIPWQAGTTSFAVDTAVYGEPVDSFATLFDPPAELQGKIGMFKGSSDLVTLAQVYLGLPFCSEDSVAVAAGARPAAGAEARGTGLRRRQHHARAARDRRACDGEQLQRPGPAGLAPESQHQLHLPQGRSRGLGGRACGAGRCAELRERPHVHQLRARTCQRRYREQPRGLFQRREGKWRVHDRGAAPPPGRSTCRTVFPCTSCRRAPRPRRSMSRRS